MKVFENLKPNRGAFRFCRIPFDVRQRSMWSNLQHLNASNQRIPLRSQTKNGYWVGFQWDFFMVWFFN